MLLLRRVRGRVWLGLCAAVLLISALYGARMLGGANDGLSASIKEWRGSDAGPSDDVVIVARSDLEWRQLWQRAGSEPPFAFNAGKQTAIGVFLGPKAMVPQTARIVSAAERDGRLVVVYEELRAGDAARVAAEIGRPWMIAVINRGDLPAVVEQRIGR